MKIIKTNNHEFLIFPVTYAHWVQCKYCGINRISTYIEYGNDNGLVVINELCLSDNEKLIKNIIE